MFSRGAPARVRRSPIVVEIAKAAEREATIAANAKAQAKGEGRATGLRTVKSMVMTDGAAAAKWAWANHKDELLLFVQQLAEKDMRAGVGFSALSGLEIKWERL